jgi:predicted nucleic acid-binding protein
MSVVVADTGPLHYLVLTDSIDLLPRLFHTVHAPMAVLTELNHPRTPDVVRAWSSLHPPWLNWAPTPPLATLPWPRLGDGERAALALASTIGADLMLTDDRAGATAGRAEGFTVMGTLGVLSLAAERGMIDLAASLARLQATNFRINPQLVDALLAQYRARPSS